MTREFKTIATLETLLAEVSEAWNSGQSAAETDIGNWRNDETPPRQSHILAIGKGWAANDPRHRVFCRSYAATIAAAGYTVETVFNTAKRRYVRRLV